MLAANNAQSRDLARLVAMLKEARRRGVIVPSVPKITNEEQLRAYVVDRCGVNIPATKVCKKHTTPWRAFADAYFARSPVAVWKASRGFGGKSFLLALLGLVEAQTMAANVVVLGGSGEQSQRVHEYMQGFWGHAGAPKHLLASDPSKRATRLSTGNAIHALTASSRSVRGPHPQRLRLDEIDEMDIRIFDAAMGQPIGATSIPKQTVASSTHHYANKTMTEVLTRATDRGWPVYEWCYQETCEPHGWLPITEVDSKRHEVTQAMWEAEYDLQDPSPDTRAIAPDKVGAMFNIELGEYDGAPGEYIEIEPPAPGGKYVTGADWAKKRDFTVIVTLRIDTVPMRLVAFERFNRLPWPAMYGRYNDRLDRYPGEGVHDGTGIGDVVEDHIVSSAFAFIMVGRKRDDMLSNYVSSVERGEIEAPFIAFMERSHRLASVDDVYGSGHLPDDIAAMALARHGARYDVQVAGG